MQSYGQFLKGLEIATKILHERNEPVTIFLRLTESIKSNSTNRFLQQKPVLRNLTYQKAGELQRNGHLVAGLTGLTGNEEVDSAAKSRAQRGGKQAERWSSALFQCSWHTICRELHLGIPY